MSPRVDFKILTLFFVFFTSTVSFGAAYVPDQGHGIAIIGVNSYQARSQFDKNKSVSPFGQNGKFTKQELYYYLAYAIRNDWALIASGTLLNELSYKNDFDKKTFSGSGDQYVAARYFFKKDASGAQALQLGASLPVYSNNANPAPGNSQNDLEIRYLRDHFQVFGPSFFSWEIAYRYRSSTPSDQLRADLSFGKTFDKWILMLHSNAIKGLRNQSGQRSSSNPNTAADFDLLKIGASAAFRYNGKDAVQFGLMEDILGRKTGKGRGIFLAWWKGF